MSEYDYGYEHDNTYCYPGTDVLINRLNIRDQHELTTTERDISALRILQLDKKPVSGNFDFDHLKDIHYFIFRDIYEWAGKIRTIDISKGVKFCRSEYIEENAKKIFEDLKKDNSKTMDENQLVLFLTHCLCEINALHPFREGNGRAQRAFVNALAQSHGHYLDFSKISNREMIEASYHSFMVDESKMIPLIKRIIEPLD